MKRSTLFLIGVFAIAPPMLSAIVALALIKALNIRKFTSKQNSQSYIKSNVVLSLTWGLAMMALCAPYIMLFLTD